MLKISNKYEPTYRRIQALQRELRTIPKDADKVKLQMIIVQKYDSLFIALPDNATIKTEAAGAYGNLAWYQLFTQDFKGAATAAQQGLALDPTQQWININLANAYLFSGQYQKAKVIYADYKDKPWSESGGDGDYKTYKEVFLEDLETLEKAGIKHKKVKKIRKLLNR